MSAVATAVVGSAVIGGVVASSSAKKQAGAVEAGAAASAEAQIESTKMQVEELGRQFDIQMGIIAPLLQSQYNAQGAYNDLLGISGSTSLPASGGGTFTGGIEGQAPGSPNYIGSGSVTTGQENVPRGTYLGGNSVQDFENWASDYQWPEEWTQNTATSSPLPTGRTNQDMEFSRAPDGTWYDPNLDQTQFSETDALPDYIADNPLAGPLEDDLLVNRAEDVRMATGDFRDDPRFRYAEDNYLTGPDFESSPGYAFQVEEMQRELDRKNSAGGNYGGRAVMEAQRRAQGLAAQDYYNWANLRHADLRRGDIALEDWQRRGVMDVTRGDQALQDYQRRADADVGRGEQAILNNQQLAIRDQQRRDAQYYAYLDNLARAANPSASGQAVSAAGAYGANVAGSYANQGNALSSIYSTLGGQQANIYGQQGANVNNAIQSGIGNLMFYDYMRRI